MPALVFSLWQFQNWHLNCLHCAVLSPKGCYCLLEIVNLEFVNPSFRIFYSFPNLFFFIFHYFTFSLHWFAFSSITRFFLTVIFGSNSGNVNHFSEEIQVLLCLSVSCSLLNFSFLLYCPHELLDMWIQIKQLWYMQHPWLTD